MVIGDALKYRDNATKHVELEQTRHGGFKYNVTMDCISIHSKRIDDRVTLDQGVLLDTGTSNLVVPESVSGPIVL